MSRSPRPAPRHPPRPRTEPAAPPPERPRTEPAAPPPLRPARPSRAAEPLPAPLPSLKVSLPPGPHRCGMVALVGRPNVGKSTLLNGLVGEKIAATTPKPQTTRRRMRGIVNLQGAQLIFVDTPGLFDAAIGTSPGAGGYGELGTFMAREAKSAIGDVDAVVWLVEPVGEEPDAAHLAIAKLIRDGGKPCVLAINKIDTVAKAALLPMLQRWKELLPFAALVPLSARQGDGREQLVLEVAKLLPEGPALFPDADLTDATERDVVAELVREKAMLFTGEEVPYAIAVEVERFDETRREKPGPRGGVVEIDVTLHVERDGQKAILVGKGGDKAKEIGISARRQIEAFLGCRVMLRLFVKVSEGWTRNARSMGHLGYR